MTAMRKQIPCCPIALSPASPGHQLGTVPPSLEAPSLGFQLGQQNKQDPKASSLPIAPHLHRPWRTMPAVCPADIRDPQASEVSTTCKLFR